MVAAGGGDKIEVLAMGVQEFADDRAAGPDDHPAAVHIVEHSSDENKGQTTTSGSGADISVLQRQRITSGAVLQEAGHGAILVQFKAGLPKVMVQHWRRQHPPFPYSVFRLWKNHSSTKHPSRKCQAPFDFMP